MTGHALAEDLSAFLAAGANAVYTKPISRAQLHQALLQQVSSATLGTPSTAALSNDAALAVAIGEGGWADAARKQG